jgi:hypothetical protein
MSLLKIRLHNFFYLLLTGLSQSLDLGRKFDRLIQVDSCFFYLLSMRLSWIFFSNFILQYWVYWILGFIIYCGLIYTWLARTYNPCYRFDGLTRVCFLSFNWPFFFNVIIQHQVDWELGFIIYFGLFFMRFSQSHNSSCGFGELTRLTWVLFWIFHWHFLYFMIRHWLDCELGFMIYFVLFSMRLSSLMLRSRVLRVNICRLKLFHCVLFLNWFFYYIFNI